MLSMAGIRILSRGGGGQVCSPPLEGKEFPYPLLLYNILLPPIWSPLPTTSSPAIYKLGGGEAYCPPQREKNSPILYYHTNTWGRGGGLLSPPQREKNSPILYYHTEYFLLTPPVPLP